MSITKFIASAGLVAAFTVATSPSAFAQQRGRAVPRGSVRGGGPVHGGGGVRVGRPVVVAPYRGFYGYRSYVPRVNFSFFYGRPGFYGAYGFGNPFYSYGYPYYYGYPAYAYPYPAYGYGSVNGYAPYGYGYGGYSGRPYGGLRIDLPQRDAEVYVDGYFVGTVDNFDGVAQQANLEAGPHQIEIRSPEFQSIEFSVNIEPGRTITYRGSMHDLRP